MWQSQEHGSFKPQGEYSSSWVFSHSDTQAVKRCNHCLQSDFQWDMSEIKLASCYKITTKDKIPSAVPSLQLFQQAEGEVCL